MTKKKDTFYRDNFKALSEEVIVLKQKPAHPAKFSDELLPLLPAMNGKKPPVEPYICRECGAPTKTIVAGPGLDLQAKVEKLTRERDEWKYAAENAKQVRQADFLMGSAGYVSHYVQLGKDVATLKVENRALKASLESSRNASASLDRHFTWEAEHVKQQCKTCRANKGTTFDYGACSACAEKTPFKQPPDQPVKAEYEAAMHGLLGDMTLKSNLATRLQQLIDLITGDQMQGMNDVRLVKAIREKFEEVYGKLDDFANRSNRQDDLFTAFMYTVLREGIN